VRVKIDGKLVASSKYLYIYMLLEYMQRDLMLILSFKSLLYMKI